MLLLWLKEWLRALPERVAGFLRRAPGWLWRGVKGALPVWLWQWLRTLGLILGGLVIAGALFGTPYVGWNYGCAIGPAYGDTGYRFYNWCEYYGLQGRRVLHGEQCGGGLVTPLPFDWSGRTVSP